MAARARNPLLDAHQFFRRGPVAAEGWRLVTKDRRSESFYRDRWHHDKVVRSTHGVNCTGSCSRNVDADCRGAPGAHSDQAGVQIPGPGGGLGRERR